MIKRGKVFLALKEEYKDFLLEQGIENLETFLEKHRRTSSYLKGRGLHPSIPLKDEKRAVIRQYLHGGLFRSVTRDLYFFGSRSFQELTLTEEIVASGISTIEPIGAIHRLSPPFYKAYLLSLEIPHAIDLIQYFKEIGPQPSPEKLLAKRKTIRSAGLLLRRFHQAGFFHGDLQLKNILVSGERLILIDFDRSYRKPTLTYQERMKNLLRLNRSAEKWKRVGLPITHRDRMRFFLAYADDDVRMRGEMRNAFRGYRMRQFLQRCGWRLNNFSFKK
jgi:3-deoxy-D-manno-octulosonic acid kinase